VSVVRRDARRRWTIVVGGIAALCLVPAVLALAPVPDVSADPGDLRARILASATKPYEGYVESRGAVGLPDLPELRDVVGLLSGSARIRTWYASPTAWRTALVDNTGERDMYQTADGLYLWDFERNLTLRVTGDVSTRPPWAADAVPPELARRMLRSVTQRDKVEPIAARRVAGIAAPGLRVTSADQATTIGRVDVWADPESGLPLRVEISGRGAGDPVFASQFEELSQERPDQKVLEPGETRHVVDTDDAVELALDQVARVGLPERLGGQRRVGAVDPTSGVSVYGDGWARFAVVAVRGRVGSRFLRAAQGAGGVEQQLENGRTVQIGASVLSAMVVRSVGDRQRRRTYLVAGFVSQDRLRQVGADLLANVP
jgi:hypothetical protein